MTIYQGGIIFAKAFGTGSVVHVKDSGEIRGTQIDVAVGCWFTSTGESIPKLIKWKDDDCTIHTINNITVLCKTPKIFYGNSTMEYVCRLVSNNTVKTVKLIFFIKDYKWRMVI